MLNGESVICFQVALGLLGELLQEKKERGNSIAVFASGFEILA